MREGDHHDYWHGPLHPTAQPASAAEPDRFFIEQMQGFVRYGVEQTQPIVTGVGSPAVRAINATTAKLTTTGTGTLLSQNRNLLVNDFSRNRIVTQAHGSDGELQYVHTVEVRDSYGSILSSYAVADVGGSHKALFTPSIYTADGKLAGVVVTKGMSGLGIYDELGNPANIPVVVYGTYDADDNETDLTDTVSIPGNTPINLGPVTYNGNDYYCFGNSGISVGTVGNYVIASCGTHRGQSNDPASFLVFTTSGVYCGKIAMPAAYTNAIVYKWIKAGTRTIALVRPNADATKTHMLVFTPGASTVNLTVMGAPAAVTSTLAGNNTLIDYAVYAPADDSLVVFARSASTVNGVSGTYYTATKITLTDYSKVWSTASAFVPENLPKISDSLWRSPPTSATTFSDRVLGATFKWLSNVGFHQMNLTDGSITSAAWSETDVAAPTNTALGNSPMFYDAAQDRIVFGGGPGIDVAQYTFQNNSTPATGNVSVEYHGPDFVLGGDEFSSKLGELITPDGTKTYIVNVNANRWVGVYDGISLAFVAGWDGGGTTQLGGSVVPCTGGVTLLPIQDGRLLKAIVNNAGAVSFTIVDCIEDTAAFGVVGMYVHDTSDNSLVVIGGPENATTESNFKWMIQTGSIKWAKEYSGAFTETGNDGRPTLPPCASQMVNGGFLGFINTLGAVSLISLLTGVRVYKGMAETTTGFDSTTPWTYAQWAWESETTTLVMVNTTSQFAAASTTGTIDAQLAAYNGTEPYLKAGSVNYHADLIKIKFKRNGAGNWSTEVTRPEQTPTAEKFAPDMRMWVDYGSRFAYVVSNQFLKCYDLDTLQLVATAQSGIGRSFLKVWGSSITKKLYVQYGSHDGYRTDGQSYDDPKFYTARMHSIKTYTPLMSVGVFGRHLPQGEQWATLYHEGDVTRPYEVHDVASVSMFVDYSVNDQNGHPVRYGKHHVQYYYNPIALPGDIQSDPRPSVVDEAEQLSRAYEQDALNYPINDPYASVGLIGFRYVLIEDGPEPVLHMQYRNFTGTLLSMQWNTSRPPLPVPDITPRGYVTDAPIVFGTAIRARVRPEGSAPPVFEGWYWRVWYHCFRTGGWGIGPSRVMYYNPAAPFDGMADDNENWMYGFENRYQDSPDGTDLTFVIQFQRDSTGPAVCSLVYDAGGYCSYEVLVQHWTMDEPAPVIIKEYNAYTGQHQHGYPTDVSFTLIKQDTF
jgi:hypothetical protein